MMSHFSQKIAFYTLGCKLNFAESSTISRQMLGLGFNIVNFEEKADVYVINTCSVTGHANRKCRQIISRAHKLNPHAYIAIVGCYAQLKPEELSLLPGVDLVLGIQEKFELAKHITRLINDGHGGIYGCNANVQAEFISGYSIGNRTRSFLKIQDGCDYACTYCTIPQARGNSRSNTIANVLKDTEEMAGLGVKEIVLTGVNIGDFGLHPDHPEYAEESFLSLIEALEKQNCIDRYRISSIEPNLLTKEIIHAVESSALFMPHFHIPLQSGSDHILRMMKRRYHVAHYRKKIELIKNVIPDACIGVDVIVGFPGETDDYFQETYHFLRNLDISYLHVFSYSERPNTEAIKLKNKVSDQIKQIRSKALHELSRAKKEQFYKQFINTDREVLLETTKSDGLLRGFTDNYIKIKLPGKDVLSNTLRQVKLNSIDEDGEVCAILQDKIIENV